MKSLSIKLSFIAALSLLFFACNKENPVAEDQTHQQQLISKFADAEIALLAEPEINFADQDHEFSIVNDGWPEDLDEASSHHGHHGHHHGPGPHFRIHLMRACFDSLNLSVAQIDSIRHAVAVRNQCIRPHLLQIRMIHMQIMHQHNQQRLSLMHDYHNGVITHQQLMHALQVLRQSIRNAMLNHPGRQQHLQAIHQCHVAFFTKLQSIMTTQQWDDFICCYFNHNC